MFIKSIQIVGYQQQQKYSSDCSCGKRYKKSDTLWLANDVISGYQIRKVGNNDIIRNPLTRELLLGFAGAADTLCVWSTNILYI